MDQRSTASSPSAASSRGLSRLQRLRTTLNLSDVRPLQVLGGVLMLALPIALLGYFGQELIHQSVKVEVEKSLKGSLAASLAGVELWLETCEDASQRIMRSPAVLHAASATLAACAESCPREPLASAIEPLRGVLGPRSFLVSLAKQRVIPLFGGKQRDENTEPLLALARTAKAQAAPVFIAPFLLADDDVYAGFLSPLRGAGDALFLLTEVPGKSLTRSLLAARAGRSGETYAVDRQGRMVSESRFLDQLRAIGLLRPIEASAILHVEVRDPGVDLTRGARTGQHRKKQPLTLMARALTSGRSGVRTDGYRDYRGVPVVGAWRWLPRYGIGVAVELDQGEALSSLNRLQHLFFGFLVLLIGVCIALAGVSMLAARSKLRATQALKHAERLGQYAIKRKLGQGGMGTVYLAEHALLRRPTAIKVISRERMSEESAARFELEVRATSALSHPNTVSIFDYGRADDGTFFYAMEYLEGLDLEALVVRFGPLPESRVVHILLQACGSLAEAHAKGLVHRDIKPSNLFLCGQVGVRDVVKVLDFGIVKSSLEQSTRITRSSTVIGTPEYMSPEMFDRASAVTAQTDIYSLGAVAYFLLTGLPVFDAHSMAEVCAAQLSHDPLPPSQRAERKLDPELERIVIACLAKKPDQRPRGAVALRMLLQKLTQIPAWSDAEAELCWREAARAE